MIYISSFLKPSKSNNILQAFLLLILPLSLSLPFSLPLSLSLLSKLPRRNLIVLTTWKKPRFRLKRRQAWKSLVVVYYRHAGKRRYYTEEWRSEPNHQAFLLFFLPFLLLVSLKPQAHTGAGKPCLQHKHTPTQPPGSLSGVDNTADADSKTELSQASCCCCFGQSRSCCATLSLLPALLAHFTQPFRTNKTVRTQARRTAAVHNKQHKTRRAPTGSRECIGASLDCVS